MKKTIMALTLGLLLTFLLSACGGGGKKGGDSIVIGAQSYTETKILAEMYKALIEDASDLSVETKVDFATDTIVLTGMQNGEIDMMTTYTGTALTSFFTIENPQDREATLEQAKRDFAGEDFNFIWFDSLGFENTYALAITRELAEKESLKTLSDVAPISEELTAGFDASWLEREDDGYAAFAELYGIDFKSTAPMQPGLVYDAVKSGDVDIVLAYSTDPRISAFDLVLLEDDKNFFPPYDASPVLRKETADAHPEIAETIEPLLGRFDVALMGELNKKVDVDGEEIKDVAIEYLKDEGLLD
jgi:osmoprotectant transport system substrate-binding protein